jgi:hypothetical protein
MFYSGFTNELIIRCVDCKKEILLPCTKEQYIEYRKIPREKAIRDIFPEMSPENREAFISGMCSECQKSFLERKESNK